MAVSIWKSVGTELVIFAVTLGFALSARTHQLKRPARDGGAFQGSAQARPPVPAASTMVRSTTALGDPGGRPHPKRTPASRQPSVQGEAQQCAPSYNAAAVDGPSRSGESWRIIDEIVGSSRANANLRTAHRAIELYQELQHRLREQGSNVSEATWYTRYSSLDLYSSMVQSVIRTSQCHLVERLIEDMVRQGVSRPLNFYESTMKQLAVQKHYQLALSVYDRLVADGLSPSVVTLSCLISFAAEVGAYDRAIEFFQQLAAQTKPSIRAYMTILRVYGKRQDWPASLATFREMQRQGVALDSLALNVVLATGIASDKVAEAEMLILEGHETVPPISDSVSYNTLIKGYMQRSDLASAIKVVDRMREYGIKPNSITFNTMMDRAVRFGQHNEAWKLYSMMRACGLKPDKLTASILIRGVDKAPDQREHVADCVELLREAGHLCDATLLGSLSNIVLDVAAQAGEPKLLAAAKQLHEKAAPAACSNWRSA